MCTTVGTCCRGPEYSGESVPVRQDGAAKRPRAFGGSWRTTEPRPAIGTVLTAGI